MTISADIVNRSIMLIGDNQPLITGSGNYPNPTFDSSPAGVAASQLYVDAINTMAREHGYDAFRKTAALVLTGTVAPFPWSFAYQYPIDCVELNQIIPGSVLPAPGNLAPAWTLDNNDPRPTRWNVANLVLTQTGLIAKVILSNDAGALAVYSSMPNENLWDAGFTHVVVRFLASELAMAIAGRPETSQGQLAATGQFSGVAQSRPD